MQRVTDLYRPSKLIKDIARPTAYFKARDVSASPLTPIGELAEKRPQPKTDRGVRIPVRIRKPRLMIRTARPYPPRAPVFPADFSLTAVRSAANRRRVIPVREKQDRSHIPVRVKAMLRDVAAGAVASARWVKHEVGQIGRVFPGQAIVSSAAGSTMSSGGLLPRKYTLLGGWKVDNGRVVRFSRLLVPGLIALVVLIIYLSVNTGSSDPHVNRSTETQAQTTAHKSPATSASTTDNAAPSKATNTSQPSGSSNNQPSSGAEYSAPVSPSSGAVSSPTNTPGTSTGSQSTSSTTSTLTLPGASVQIGGTSPVTTTPISVGL